MSRREYYCLLAKLDPRAAFVKRLPDYIENIGAVRKGAAIGPMASPTDVPLSEDGGDMLVDLIGNPSDAHIMSDKALAALSEEGVLSSDVEILPIRLLDKRGRSVPREYSIVNPLRTIDCLDVSRSKASVSPRGKVLSLYSLHIHEDKVPDGARLFRIREFPSYVLVSADLLEALKAKGLQGLRGVAMGEDIYE